MSDQPTTRFQVEKPKGHKVIVAAGTYFLGDPCYAVPDDDWMPLLESCGYFDDPGYANASPVGTTPAGHQVLAFSTAYGDGTYQDQAGQEYSVDAGLIGLTPVLPAPGWRYADQELNDLGQIVTFPTEVEAIDDGEGRLQFGRYHINTNEEWRP